MTVFFSMFSFSPLVAWKKKPLSYAHFLVLALHRLLLDSCGFSSWNLHWLKSIFPPAVFLFFPFLSLLVVQMNQEQTRAHIFSFNHPPLLRLRVNFALRTISTLYADKTNRSLSHDWQQKITFGHLSVSFSVFEVGLWQRDNFTPFSPWVLHSRQSWQEWVLGKGWFGGGQILGTVFYWLVGSQSHHDYQTRPGQIRGASNPPSPPLTVHVYWRAFRWCSVSRFTGQLEKVLHCTHFAYNHSVSVKSALSVFAFYFPSRRFCPLQFSECSRAAAKRLNRQSPFSICKQSRILYSASIVSRSSLRAFPTPFQFIPVGKRRGIKRCKTKGHPFQKQKKNNANRFSEHFGFNSTLATPVILNLETIKTWKQSST